jgi:hypothetical protein
MLNFRPGQALRVALVFLAASTAAVAQDIPLKQKFVVQLQDALRANDKNWLAGHMRYPVRHFGKRATLIRNKSWFVKNYRSVIGAKLRAAVLAQDPGNVFENWQGLMVGEGRFNIWVRNSGDGANERYEIVTINDAE